MTVNTENTSKCAIPTLSIIGPGRAGLTLAYSFHKTGLCTLGALIGRCLGKAEEATHWLQAGTPFGEITEEALAILGQSDFLLISTPDSTLESVVKQLAALFSHRQSTAINKSKVAFHLSGCLAACVLEPLRAYGYHLASLHPAKSFPLPASVKPEQLASAFQGLPCALEGDEKAITLLENLFTPLGAMPFVIPASNKAAYHLASVFASNAITVLFEVATSLYANAGLNKEQARYLSDYLASGSLLNLQQLSPAQALTGPIKRGDEATIRAHFLFLEHQAPHLLSLYKQLSSHALRMAQADLSEEKVSALQRLLAHYP